MGNRSNVGSKHLEDMSQNLGSISNQDPARTAALTVSRRFGFLLESVGLEVGESKDTQKLDLSNHM